MKQTPKFSFKKDLKDAGFEIRKLDCFLNQNAKISRTTAHRLTFYALIIPTQGTGKHQINFKTYDYQQKDILFIGKDRIHKWLEQNELTGYLILFTQEFIYENQKTFKDLSYSYPYNSFLYSPIIRINDSAEYDILISLIGHIYKEYYSPDTDNKQEIIQCLLRAFFLKIRSKSPIDRNESNKIYIDLFIRFQQKLDNNISITRNANDYCELLKVTYRDLNNACKTFTKKTIKAFIDEVIILKAQKYLLDEDKNISIVSYLLGFDEVSNFSKFFKKHTNQSPKQFISTLKMK